MSPRGMWDWPHRELLWRGVRGQSAKRTPPPPWSQECDALAVTPRRRGLRHHRRHCRHRRCGGIRWNEGGAVCHGFVAHKWCDLVARILDAHQWRACRLPPPGGSRCCGPDFVRFEDGENALARGGNQGGTDHAGTTSAVRDTSQVAVHCARDVRSTRARPLKLRGWGYPPSRRPGRMDPAGRVYLMDPPGRGVPTPTPPPPAGLADPPVRTDRPV
eukprot:gene4953-biopygen13096